MLKSVFKALAIAASASLLAVAAQAEDVIKIGQVAPKSGPLAGGAAVTQWPNIELWSKQVNARGGLDVGGKQMMVEIIEYDDKTNPGEHIKAAQRGTLSLSYPHEVDSDLPIEAAAHQQLTRRREGNGPHLRM